MRPRGSLGAEAEVAPLQYVLKTVALPGITGPERPFDVTIQVLTEDGLMITEAAVDVTTSQRMRMRHGPRRRVTRVLPSRRISHGRGIDRELGRSMPWVDRPARRPRHSRWRPAEAMRPATVSMLEHVPRERTITGWPAHPAPRGGRGGREQSVRGTYRQLWTRRLR